MGLLSSFGRSPQESECEYTHGTEGLTPAHRPAQEPRHTSAWSRPAHSQQTRPRSYSLRLYGQRAKPRAEHRRKTLRPSPSLPVRPRPANPPSVAYTHCPNPTSSLWLPQQEEGREVLKKSTSAPTPRLKTAQGPPAALKAPQLRPHPSSGLAPPVHSAACVLSPGSEPESSVGCWGPELLSLFILTLRPITRAACSPRLSAHSS